MSHIDKVSIMSHDERFAPPEQPVLEVSYVGPGGLIDEGIVFLKLVAVVEESNLRSEYDTIAEFGVKVTDLAKALGATGALSYVEVSEGPVLSVNDLVDPGEFCENPDCVCHA